MIGTKMSSYVLAKLFAVEVDALLSPMSICTFAETQDGSKPNADSKLVVQQKGILNICEVLQEGSPVLQQHSHKPGQFTETLDTRGLSLISLRLPSVGQYYQTLHYLYQGEERPLFDFI